jgi:hypothetical protein
MLSSRLEYLECYLRTSRCNYLHFALHDQVKKQLVKNTGAYGNCRGSGFNVNYRELTALSYCPGDSTWKV